MTKQKESERKSEEQSERVLKMHLPAISRPKFKIFSFSTYLMTAPHRDSELSKQYKN